MQDLNKFRNEMNLSGQNVYVGHRYKPKMFGEWDNTKIYEPLSIVQYQGNSFTSRQYVPVGVEITNEDYWASTGNYNAQIEQYRQDVLRNSELFETVANDKASKEDLQNTTDLIESQHLNVINYGVVGDGVTDDYDALMTAKSAALINQEELFIPKGLNIYSAKPIDLFGLRYVNIQGEVTTPELKLGYSSTQPWQTNYFVSRVKGTVKISGLKNGDTTIQAADKVLLYANGDIPTENSMAYSKFDFGFIEELELFSEGTGIGWINENIFNGGRVSKLKISGNYPHNNNTWYKPQFDNFKVEILNGHSNAFHDCRFEGTADVYFAKGTYNNYFERNYTSFLGSYGLNKSSVLRTDDGYNNKIFYTLDSDVNENVFFKLDRSQKNFDVQNTTIQGNGHVQTKAYVKLYESDLTKINDDIVISLNSDSGGIEETLGFRLIVELYDQTKTKIKPVKDTEYLSFNMTVSDTDNSIRNTANVSHSDIVILKNTTAKYYKVILQTGKLLEYKSVSLTLLKNIRNNVEVPSQLNAKGLTSNIKPTDVEGYLKGDFVTNTGNETVAGWIFNGTTWLGIPTSV